MQAVNFQESAVRLAPNDTKLWLGLADLYEAQGRFAEAEPLLKRALVINAKVLGPDHVNVAADLTGLAAVYRDQGRYKDAEALLKHALEINEKALGPEHQSVSSTLTLLGGIYEIQNRHAEAEPLFSRALGIMVKALGTDNPRVASSLNNFAAVLKEEGLYAQAEPIYKRAIAIDEKAEPEFHRHPPKNRMFGMSFAARLLCQQALHSAYIKDASLPASLGEQQWPHAIVHALP